jgi:hypothetical protein
MGGRRGEQPGRRGGYSSNLAKPVAKATRNSNNERRNRDSEVRSLGSNKRSSHDVSSDIVKPPNKKNNQQHGTLQRNSEGYPSTEH